MARPTLGYYGLEHESFRKALWRETVMKHFEKRAESSHNSRDCLLESISLADEALREFDRRFPESASQPEPAPVKASTATLDLSK